MQFLCVPEQMRDLLVTRSSRHFTVVPSKGDPGRPVLDMETTLTLSRRLSKEEAAKNCQEQKWRRELKRPDL